MNSETQKSHSKVSIIGCGYVGMATAYALLLREEIRELVLVSRDTKRITGEQLDLEHGLIFMGTSKVKATETYDDIAGSDVVIITAGAAQNPGETRLDLTKKNITIIKDIIPKIVTASPDSVIIVVTNPVDILTYHAAKIAGLPPGRVFGSGTTLDTSRFRFHLSEIVHVNPKSIHAYVLGEHGDSSFPTIHAANVGGQKLLSFRGVTYDEIMKAYDKAATAAYRIIEAKGATCYAIGVVVAHLVQAILHDSKRVTPLSTILQGEYGFSDVALSLPCVLGKNGVESTLSIALSDEEHGWLAKSVHTLTSHL